MYTFNDLLDLPRSAVFAIVDEKNKRVLVAYSTSLIASLARIVDRIKWKESFYREFATTPDLKFVVLEESDCRNRLMVRTGFYMREYRNLGYTLLDDHPPVTYTVKCVPRYSADPLTGNKAKIVLQAMLVSKRNSKILVGEFLKQADYDAFISLNYCNEIVYDIIYDVSVKKRIDAEMKDWG